MKARLFSALILLFLFSACGQKPAPPLAENGVLDLCRWNFRQNGNAGLKGEWSLYPEQLMTPAQLCGPHPKEPDGTIPMPGFWTGKGSKSYATLRLQLKLAPGHPDLALLMGDFWSAYRIWVNGKPMASVGTVGKSGRDEVPGHGVRIIPINTGEGLVDLVFQVSNFFYSIGAVADTVKIGREADIRAQAKKTFGYAVLVSGCLLVMGFYHFLLYFIRPRDRSTLFFGLFCMELGIWYLVSNSSDRFLWDILPFLNLNHLFRIDLLSFYLAVPTALMYFHSCFPQEAIKIVQRFSLGLALIFSLIVLLTPVRIFSHTLLPYFIIAVFTLFYGFFILVRAFFQKREGSAWILAGFAVFAVTALNDILYSYRMLQTGFTLPLGVLGLIISNSLVLALKFFKSFSMVENMSRELAGKNIELSRLDRIKDEFLANTSHELRTPLHGIIGLAESIRDGALGKVPDKIRTNLDLITASGRRLSHLINDILDFSRLRNRDLKLDRKPVDIRALADTVTIVSEQLIKGKDLVIENKIPQNISPVFGDELRLQQILYNLVGNAVKFTDQGSITLSAVETKELVEISVSDTGIGIGSEHVDEIFESFKQVKGSESRPFEGAGLGLAITRRLVNLHQGDIRVTSVLGRGTTFFVSLPAAKDRPAPADPGASPLPFPKTGILLPAPPPVEISIDRQENQAVLAVDDDPVNLQVVANHLSFLKAVRVHTKMNGPDALAWIRENGPPDLILLDIMMPGMTGYEVCRTLRKTHTAPDLPVIILTAKNRVSDLVEGFACGANDYLTKPFSGKELLARVKTHLDLKKSWAALEENIRLKKDIEQRKRTELDLKMTQTRLSRILDSLDDAVVAVNESLEICFCNFTCEKLLGYEPENLLGRPILRLFQAGSRKEADKLMDLMINGNDLSAPANEMKSAVLVKKDRQTVLCRIQVAFLDLDHEQPLLIMVIQDKKQHVSGRGDEINLVSPVPFINELNQTMERIKALEDFITRPEIPGRESEIKNNLNRIGKVLRQAEKALPQLAKKPEKNTLGVHAMTLALECWEQATGLTKADLARSSGIWTVYMTKDGFERTQTMDKYLSIKKFPKRPRWNKIFQTLDFVLLSCEKDSRLKTELEKTYSKLRRIK